MSCVIWYSFPFADKRRWLVRCLLSNPLLVQWIKGRIYIFVNLCPLLQHHQGKCLMTFFTNSWGGRIGALVRLSNMSVHVAIPRFHPEFDLQPWLRRGLWALGEESAWHCTWIQSTYFVLKTPFPFPKIRQMLRMWRSYAGAGATTSAMVEALRRMHGAQDIIDLL